MAKPSPRNPSVAVTVGDPAGIGPEVILKALAKIGTAGVRVIGPFDVFERTQKQLKTKVDLSVVDDAIESPGRFATGNPAKATGNTARLALELGAHLLRTGQADALVTAPVSKEALRLAGFTWPGQTEFLAARLNAERSAMLAWTPSFKAVLVTIHLPLALASRSVSADAVFEKTSLLNDFLRREAAGAKRSASSKPRLCALAFNPHAREFTQGEEDRIAAGITRAIDAGIDVVGPLPADAALARRENYDGFVAMYHDQGMIPAKLLAQGRGVNVTLGLSRIRTSPLHGTAFDIAGRGKADPASMLEAIRLARKLAR